MSILNAESLSRYACAKQCVSAKPQRVVLFWQRLGIRCCMPPSIRMPLPPFALSHPPQVSGVVTCHIRCNAAIRCRHASTARAQGGGCHLNNCRRTRLEIPSTGGVFHLRPTPDSLVTQHLDFWQRPLAIFLLCHPYNIQTTSYVDIILLPSRPRPGGSRWDGEGTKEFVL